eukprot:2562356-Rhodomonas_salina.1
MPTSCTSGPIYACIGNMHTRVPIRIRRCQGRPAGTPDTGCQVCIGVVVRNWVPCDRVRTTLFLGIPPR